MIVNPGSAFRPMEISDTPDKDGDIEISLNAKTAEYDSVSVWLNRSETLKLYYHLRTILQLSDA